MLVEDQSEVMAFLARPETYGPTVHDIDRVDTHASAVFLAGDRAYKLKRAVKYPYLDYSTLDKREKYCRAEVAVNRRTAPSLYRGVRAVTRDGDGGLRFDGDGTVLDWVVEMTRFPQDAIFDHLADGGVLDRFAMEHLADCIARFHANAEVKQVGDGAWLIGRVLESNRSSFAELPEGILEAGAVDRLDRESAASLARVAPILDGRAQAGKVRHCHGDLHLRNIVAHEGEPVLFDAIEFDPALADIDVLYDLAFLVMDLEYRRMRPLASIVLNRYFDVTGDAAGLAAMPLFLSVRAAIRSHISAMAAANQTAPDAAAAERDAARRYLDLALRYLQRPEPGLIAVGGFSGSGKSRLARDLAPRLAAPVGARVVRTDATRKRLSGVGMLTRLGSGGYTEAMNARTYEAVFEETAAVLAGGHPVIADAVFLTPEERRRIEAVAGEAGVPFRALWLETAPEILEERVGRRKMNASDATPVVVRMQLESDLSDLRWPRVDSSGTEAETMDKALAILNLPSGQEG